MSTQAKSKSTPKARGRNAPKPFIKMIQEAIKSGDEKKGVSRAAIKNFITGKYAVSFSDRTKVSALNRAIKKGLADKAIRNGRSTGVFRLGKEPAKKSRKSKKSKPKAAGQAAKAEKKPKAKAVKSPKPAKVAKPKTVKKAASLKKTTSKAANEQ